MTTTSPTSSRQLPEAFTQQVLEAMDEQDRARLEQVMVYDEDTAGGLMNTDAITIRADVTLDVVLRYLRRHEEMPGDDRHADRGQPR
jgi:magnesium transporter